MNVNKVIESCGTSRDHYVKYNCNKNDNEIDVNLLIC